MGSPIGKIYNRINSIIIAIVSYLLLINVFLLRGEWLEKYINFSKAVPILIVLQLLFILVEVLRRQRMPVPPMGFTIYLLLVWFNTLFGIFVYRQPLLPAIYVPLEITMNILLMYIFYYAVKKGMIETKKIFAFYVFAAAIISIMMIIRYFQMPTFRRFKEFGTSVNFLSNSLSIAMVMVVYNLIVQRLVKGSIIRDIALLSIISMGLFLTGSRSGVLSFAIGLIVILFDKNKFSMKKMVILVISIAVIILAINYFLIDEKMKMLLERYTLTFIRESGRLELWVESFNGITASSLFLGRPWLYEVYGIGSVHPHNYFISLIRYTGVFPCIIFIYEIMKLYFGKKAMVIENKRLYVSLLLVILVYASVSGNFTRIMTMFIIIGMIKGMESKNEIININCN